MTDNSAQLIQPLIDRVEKIRCQMTHILKSPGTLDEQDLADVGHIITSAEQLDAMLHETQLMSRDRWDRQHYHDLRAYLNGIVGFASLLKDSAQLDHQQRDLVLQTQQDGRSLADLMDAVFTRDT